MLLKIVFLALIIGLFQLYNLNSQSIEKENKYSEEKLVDIKNNLKEDLTQNQQLGFIENIGQWPEEVLFLASGNSLQSFITKNSIIFVQTEQNINSKSKQVKKHAVKLKFNNANSLEVVKSDLGVNRVYFSKGKEILKPNLYKEIILKDFYKNIDIKYYFENGEIRYDFIVNPFADISQINFSVEGANQYDIEKESIIMKTDISNIIQKDLKCFQINDKTQIEIESSFKLKDDYVYFDVEEYDKSKLLIIDPITFDVNYVITSSMNNIILDMDFDYQGNILFGGGTTDYQFPATLGTFVSDWDCLAGKYDLSLNSSALKWILIFGGTKSETATQIEFMNDKIYLEGLTESNNFQPITLNNLHNSFTYGNDTTSNHFITVLDLEGDVLYSTYINTFSTKRNYSGLKVDTDGSIYLAGETLNLYTPLFTQINGLFTQQTLVTNSQHGFVMKLEESNNSTGLYYSIEFSTLFGGNNNTIIQDIDLDENRNIYIVGLTQSTASSFGITTGAYDTNPNLQNDYRNFIAKIHYEDLSQHLNLDYNTYYNQEFVRFDEIGIKEVLYNNGIVYFVGSTTNQSTPLENEFDDDFTYSNPTIDTRDINGIVGAISMDGNGTNDLKYSTFFGNSMELEHLAESPVQNLYYDNLCDKLIITGWTGHEIDNYQGTPLTPYVAFNHNAYIGIIDIYETGVNTLTDFNYIGDTYQWVPRTIVHLPNINKIFTAGRAEDFIVNKFNYSSCYEECECPTDPENGIDTWFTLEAEEGNGCDVGKCNLSHSLEIPPQYSCFDGYKIKINDGSYSQLIPYFGSNKIEGIADCINPGEEYTVTIRLYKLSNPLDFCEIEKTVQCPCYCPSYDDGFLTFEFSQDPSCDVFSCLVEFDFQLPEYIEDCYELVEVATYLEGQPIAGPTMHPIDLFNISQYNRCIGNFEVLKIEIRLFKNFQDQDPCVISKEIYCNMEPTTSDLCIDDCGSVPWMKGDDIYFTIPPGCLVKGSYEFRESCDGAQEIQITGIDYITNGNPNGCANGDLANATYILLDEIILRNQMEFEPKLVGCDDTWRISNSSCWYSEMRVAIDEEEEVIKITYVNRPCNSECCKLQLRICRDSEGNISKTKLSFISTQTDCESIDYVGAETSPNPYTIFPCFYSCEMLNGYISQPNKLIYDQIEYIENKNVDDLVKTEININNLNNYLNFKIQNNILDIIDINIYNLNGELLKTKTHSLNKGLNIDRIDISNLISGLYICTINSNGKQILSHKFIVTR